MACEDARENQQNNGKTRRKSILYEWSGLLFWLRLFLFCLLLRSFVNGDLRFGPETIGDMIVRKDIYAGVVGENPGRILPGMRLYILERSRKLTDDYKR